MIHIDAGVLRIGAGKINFIGFVGICTHTQGDLNLFHQDYPEKKNIKICTYYTNNHFTKFVKIWKKLKIATLYTKGKTT